ncbi:MAG: tetratricopeptide repeat protein [Alphaproteobacteria bacterium]
MAIDPSDPHQDALFREVDEDLRHEQMERLWKKYGNVAIGIAVMIVMIVGGREAWTTWQANRLADEAMRYGTAVAMIDAGVKEPAAQALVTLAEEAGATYRTLATLRRGDFLADVGDRAGAIAAWRMVAADQAADQAYRDAAAVLVAMHGLDDADPRQIETTLMPLTAAGNPYRFTALELSALAAMRAGDDARAREVLTRLADDPETPPGVRARAAEMLSQARSSLSKG